MLDIAVWRSRIRSRRTPLAVRRSSDRLLPKCEQRHNFKQIEDVGATFMQVVLGGHGFPPDVDWVM